LQLASVAASIAGAVGATLTATAATSSSAAPALGWCYSIGAALSSVAILWRPRAEWAPRVALGVASATLVLVILGTLSFGPLFLPAALFWVAAAVIGTRVTHVTWATVVVAAAVGCIAMLTAVNAAIFIGASL